MNWFTGVVLFIVIWWTALFAVLPIGTKPVDQADDTSGGGARRSAAYDDEGYHYNHSRVSCCGPEAIC